MSKAATVCPSSNFHEASVSKPLGTRECCGVSISNLHIPADASALAVGMSTLRILMESACKEYVSRSVRGCWGWGNADSAQSISVFTNPLLLGRCLGDHSESCANVG